MQISSEREIFPFFLIGGEIYANLLRKLFKLEAVIITRVSKYGKYYEESNSANIWSKHKFWNKSRLCTNFQFYFPH